MLDKEDIDKLQAAVDAMNAFLVIIADFFIDFATTFCELFNDQKELEFNPEPDPIKLVKNKDALKECPRCHGRCEIMVREKLIDSDGSEDIGATPQVSVCPRCNGEGVIL